MKGVPLYMGVTNNFPLYDFVEDQRLSIESFKDIVEKLIDLTNKFHSENVYHQDLHWKYLG